MFEAHERAWVVSTLKNAIWWARPAPGVQRRMTHLLKLFERATWRPEVFKTVAAELGLRFDYDGALLPTDEIGLRKFDELLIKYLDQVENNAKEGK